MGEKQSANHRKGRILRYTNPKESSKRCEVVLPSISFFSPVSEDRLWWPVRTLKWYIRKYSPCQQSKQLFISLVTPHSPVFPGTISRWIVQCIRAGALKLFFSVSTIPAWNLRSSTSRALIIPKSTITWGQRAFAHAGPYLWNSLLEDIKNCKSSESFKNHLKTYLFTHC